MAQGQNDLTCTNFVLACCSWVTDCFCSDAHMSVPDRCFPCICVAGLCVVGCNNAAQCCDKAEKQPVQTVSPVYAIVTSAAKTDLTFVQAPEEA